KCRAAEAEAEANAKATSPASSPGPPPAAPPMGGTETPGKSLPSPSLASPLSVAPSASLALAVPVAAFDAPTLITVSHWNRILEGELLATSSRLDWAVLMQRTFGFR